MWILMLVKEKPYSPASKRNAYYVLQRNITSFSLNGIYWSNEMDW